VIKKANLFAIFRMQETNLSLPKRKKQLFIWLFAYLFVPSPQTFMKQKLKTDPL